MSFVFDAEKMGLKPVDRFPDFYKVSDMRTIFFQPEVNWKFVLRKEKQEYYNKVRYIYSIQKPLKPHGSANFKTILDDYGCECRVNLKTGEVTPKRRQEVLESIKKSCYRSLKNARSILESNVWSFFLTLTFNEKYQKRGGVDDKTCQKHFKNYLDWLNKNVKKAYIFSVPERQQDGTLHYHCLIGGCTLEDLKADYRTYRRSRTGEVRKVYKICKNVWRYGYSDLESIENVEKTVNYITKYITKTFCDSTKYKKRFYYSRNCKKPQITVKKIILTVKDGLQSVDVRSVAEFDLFNEDYNLFDSFVKMKYYSKDIQYCVFEHEKKDIVVPENLNSILRSECSYSTVVRT